MPRLGANVPLLGRREMNTPMKIFVILVGAFLVLNLAPFVVAIVAIVGGLAIPLGTLYGIYRLIWWLVVGKRASAGYPARPAGMAAGGAAASVAARPAAPQQAAKRRMYETPVCSLDRQIHAAADHGVDRIHVGQRAGRGGNVRRDDVDLQPRSDRSAA